MTVTGLTEYGSVGSRKHCGSVRTPRSVGIHSSTRSPWEPEPHGSPTVEVTVSQAVLALVPRESEVRLAQTVLVDRVP